ncbi:hypothetical protein [Mycoplana rhizolycopersici]|uniref:hypothetical protein n=1 Tax=Mycoplana rhizolycopersici TaxID=2746702 RepID=UPI001AED8B2C|nr:hypothetical protein [Rhizobium rhizolycopersici]
MGIRAISCLSRSTAIACVLAACAGTAALAADISAADAIFVGGEIVTINDAEPTAEALAVKNGLILAVGSAR